MIFAKIDVTLAYHEKAHLAGAAMATWTWALLYTRDQERDGFVPRVALRMSWVGEPEATAHAAQLVVVGLWDEVDGGWQINGYEEKNETKAAIDDRRRETRDRVSKARKRGEVAPASSPSPTSPLVTDASDVPPVTRYSHVTDPVCNANVPGSGSGSVSGYGSLDLAGGSIALDAPLLDDARMVWDTIAMSTGSLQALDVGTVWAGFCGHHVDKPLASRKTVLGAWQKWISNQAAWAKRDRVRDADREIRGAPARAGRAKQPGGSTAGWNKPIVAKPGDERWDGSLPEGVT